MNLPKENIFGVGLFETKETYDSTTLITMLTP
jgi:hypothetical protein